MIWRPLLLLHSLSLLAWGLEVECATTDLCYGRPKLTIDASQLRDLLKTASNSHPIAIRGTNIVTGVLFAKEGAYFWSLQDERELVLVRDRVPLGGWGLERKVVVLQEPLKVFAPSNRLSSFKAPMPPFEIVIYFNSGAPVPRENPSLVSTILTKGALSEPKADEERRFRLPQDSYGNFRGEGYLRDSRNSIFYWNVISDRSLILRDQAGLTRIVRLQY